MGKVGGIQGGLPDWGHLWNLTHGRCLNLRDLVHVSEMRELPFFSVLLSSLTALGKLTDPQLETAGVHSGIQ